MTETEATVTRGRGFLLCWHSDPRQVDAFSKSYHFDCHKASVYLSGGVHCTFYQKARAQVIKTGLSCCSPNTGGNQLTLKAPITTAADDNFCEIFPNFRKNKVYFMRIVCQQTILMKYHALFVIFEKAAKFAIVVCCKL